MRNVVSHDVPRQHIKQCAFCNYHWDSKYLNRHGLCPNCVNGGRDNMGIFRFHNPDDSLEAIVEAPTYEDAWQRLVARIGTKDKDPAVKFCIFPNSIKLDNWKCTEVPHNTCPICQRDYSYDGETCGNAECQEAWIEKQGQDIMTLAQNGELTIPDDHDYTRHRNPGDTWHHIYSYDIVPNNGSKLIMLYTDCGLSLPLDGSNITNPHPGQNRCDKCPMPART